MKLAGLRRRLRPWEVAGAVLALREEKKRHLLALRERLAIERDGKREEWRRSRGTPAPRVE